MGGPSSPFEVESFLKNMFSDPHILQIKSSFLRKIVGNIIINKRLKIAQANYKAIGGGSPITPITFSLIQKLSQMDSNTFYTYAMRYTPPFASMVVQELKSKAIESVTLLSLYPQYSTTTTLSSLEDFKLACKQNDYSAKIKIIDRFFDHPLFLDCIQERIQETLKEKNPKDYILLLSAHGLPQSIINQGDPYQKECELNKEALKQHLEKNQIFFADILLSYQSKVGRMKWIGPSTEETIKKLKHKKIILYPLAFSIDNSETYFELDIELRKEAQRLKFEDFLLCPCPNDSEAFAKLILNLTQGENNEM